MCQGEGFSCSTQWFRLTSLHAGRQWNALESQWQTFHYALWALPPLQVHKAYCVCVCVGCAELKVAKKGKETDTHSSSYQGNSSLYLASFCFIIGGQSSRNVVGGRFGENSVILIVEEGYRRNNGFKCKGRRRYKLCRVTEAFLGMEAL